MKAKAFRGTIFELNDFLNEFFEENKNISVKNFQMFPFNEKYKTELNEPYYDVMVLFKEKKARDEKI